MWVTEKRRVVVPFVCCVVMALCGCVQHVRSIAEARLATSPDLSKLPICHGFGCSIVTDIALTEADWERVAIPFNTAALSPAEERSKVAEAVGVFETIAGTKAGTASDLPRAALFGDDPSQQDCIDEAVNTTLVLKLLQSRGLLRFHIPVRTANRGDGIGSWFHNTAVLQEKESDAQFAIDSWFGANGARADVVPLDAWRAGWQPAPVEPQA